jgi:hypothetical protein
VIEIPVEAVLRVYRFRCSDSEPGLDDAIRDRVLPDLAGATGMRAAYAGRRGTGQDVERAVASVWECGGTEIAAPPESAVLERSGHAGALADGVTVDVLSLAVAIAADRSESPRILRVFRGQVLEGQLDRYIEMARSGTLADLETNDGLVALYLSTQRPARFITVSVWTSWAAIESATGGNIRSPMATRNAGLIETGNAAHYEMFAGGWASGRR